MQSMSDRIKKRIQKKGRGTVFTPLEFLDLGPRDSIDQTLSRLARGGVIRRLGRGLYDYPRSSPLLGVELSPDPGTVARALARKSGGRLQVAGAHAANALGLSTQTPARVVYLTDGPTRRTRVGNQTIELRRTAPRYMAGAGKKSGMVIQALRHLGREHVDDAALRHLGREHVDDAAIRHLRKALSEKEKAELKRGMVHAPDWMRPVIEEVVRRPEGEP